VSKDSWQKITLNRIYRRREETNRSDLPLLSVYRDFGVVERAGRDDNNNKPGEDLNAYRVVYPGDLVLNKMKTWQGSLGVSSFHGIVSPAYFVCRQISEGDPRFLHHLLRSQHMIDKYAAHSKGIRPSQWDLPWDEFASFEVSLPSIAEQKAIADYLDRETTLIDTLIDRKMRILTLIGDRTEILLAKYVDELIERYGEVPLKSVAKLSVSNVDKKSYEGQIPVQLCNYTDVYYQRKISKEIVFMDATADFAQIQKLTLNKGDVLITKDSETADDIAVPALVVEDLPGVVLGYHLALLRPFGILGDFLYWVVLSRRCRDAFSLAASGVTRFGLRQDAIARVSIATAPLEEQKSLVKLIENSVSSGDSVVDLIQRQVALLKERRQALITAAVTGEIEISEVAA
jgi:type I restriction enzyme S subunit